jgi:hypothetical protein
MDTGGNVQPAAVNPQLLNKITYWKSNGQIARMVKITA